MRQMILVAGAGQNVGKTTLACRIIQQLSIENETTAIKISGHHHRLTKKQKIIYQTSGLTISEELNRLSQKDSSLFLQNGATKSFFIQVDDNKLDELARWIKHEITGWVVCESGTIGRIIRPNSAYFIENSGGKIPDWKFPYQTVRHDGTLPRIKELLNGLK